MKYQLRAHVLEVLGVTLGFSVGCGGQVEPAQESVPDPSGDEGVPSLNNQDDDGDEPQSHGGDGEGDGGAEGGGAGGSLSVGEGEPAPRALEELTDDVCGGVEDPGWIQNLNPAEAVDALALRRFPEQPFLYEQPSGPALEQAVQALADELVVEEIGGDCAAVPGCPDAPLPMQSSRIVTQMVVDHYSPSHLVAYRGAEATIYYTPEELRAFLGTIDTPEEAKLILMLKDHYVSCGESNFTKDGSDYVFFTHTGQPCGDDVVGHVMRVSAEGKLTQEEKWILEVGDKNCVIGRLPQSLCVEQPATRSSQHAEYMARVAYLEAASVAAFQDIQAELLSYGAPGWLCDWAARAAREEQRHALHCRALTRKFGGVAAVPEVASASMRSRLDLALDNAREGLTREAFGALVAAHQALMAQDSDVKHIMRSIAEDEMGHAEFSLVLHQYLMSTLSQEERAQVEAERSAAITSFGDQLLQEESDALRKDLGLPDRDTARVLFTRLFERAEIFQS